MGAFYQKLWALYRIWREYLAPRGHFRAWLRHCWHEWLSREALPKPSDQYNATELALLCSEMFTAPRGARYIYSRFPYMECARGELRDIWEGALFPWDFAGSIFDSAELFLTWFAIFFSREVLGEKRLYVVAILDNQYFSAPWLMLAWVLAYALLGLGVTVWWWVFVDPLPRYRALLARKIAIIRVRIHTTRRLVFEVWPRNFWLGVCGYFDIWICRPWRYSVLFCRRLVYFLVFFPPRFVVALGRYFWKRARRVLARVFRG